MTTCVYCEKNIDEWGNYKERNCPRLERMRDDQCMEDICDKCRYYIEGGEEVPYV